MKYPVAYHNIPVIWILWYAYGGLWGGTDWRYHYGKRSYKI